MISFKKLFFCFTILILMQKFCVGQVAFQKLWTDFNVKQVQQVYNFTAINSSAEVVTGKVEISVSNRVAGLEFVSLSNEISMKPGDFVSSNNLFWSSKLTADRLAILDRIANSGQFARGEYSICYKFLDSDTSVSKGQSCFEQKISLRNELRLVFPADNSTINNTQPTLLWSFISEFPIDNISYSVTIVEFQDGQSTRDAIKENAPILINENILGMAMPISNPNLLQHGKKYVWEVSVIESGRVLLASDIWEFEIEQGASDLSPRQVSYGYPKLKESGDVFLFTDKIKIAYNNRTLDSQLNYKFLDAESNELIFESSDLPVLNLKGGINYIDLAVSEIPNFEPKNQYLLVITNKLGRQLFLKFYIV